MSQFSQMTDNCESLEKLIRWYSERSTRGQRGPTGPQGDKGDDGKKGPKGDPGSIYEIEQTPCPDQSQMNIVYQGDEIVTDPLSINILPENIGWLARIPAQEGIKNCRGLGSTDWQGRPDNSDILDDPTGIVSSGYTHKIANLQQESISGGDYSGIGSGAENYIGLGGLGSVISGGIANRIANLTMEVDEDGRPIITDINFNTGEYYYNTIGGGYYNIAGRQYGITIGGGQENTASGTHSTIGGGHGNISSGNCSTISGGCSNTASGDHSTIGGGQDNEANEPYSSILGGQGLITSYPHSVIIGKFNDTTAGDPTPGGSGDDGEGPVAFAVGHGTGISDDSDERANILTLYTSGKLFITDQLVEGQGADYSEIFWSEKSILPGTPVIIDRYGLISEYVDEDPELIIGVVSNMSSIITNGSGKATLIKRDELMKPIQKQSDIEVPDGLHKITVGLVGQVYIRDEYLTQLPTKWRVLDYSEKLCTGMTLTLIR